MSEAGLASVRDHVVASRQLAGRLAAILDGEELCTAVLELATTIGADVTSEELADSLLVGKRRGFERWR